MQQTESKLKQRFVPCEPILNVFKDINQFYVHHIIPKSLRTHVISLKSTPTFIYDDILLHDDNSDYLSNFLATFQDNIKRLTLVKADHQPSCILFTQESVKTPYLPITFTWRE